jgi:eukaryotic-like serine/threonine-protein kinase
VSDVERICLAALDRPAGDRAAFLEDACRGDEALRRDVESLLAHASSAEQFIEHPAVDGAGALYGLSGLSIGERLGPYHIVARLGAGGMGEVYRAHDMQLGREVAIKILPAVFAADPQRLARFEAEARVLASLNHPNIATIYGVEHVDRSSGAGQKAIHALILEVVEGDTLEDRIAQSRGGLPLAEALGIARQIADALEAAHAKDVVHRDLKPANIKVRPDGVVKVLDFGVAKALAPAAADGPPVTTEPGLIVGTPAYMSPEQARGAVVDHRADIWAFGVLVYELLTGVAPFVGPTIADTLARVLASRADELRLPVNTPPSVQRLIHRCLERDRRRRLQHIGDARIEVDDALTDAEITPHDGRPAASRRTFMQRLATIAVVSVIAGAAVWWLATHRTAPAASRVVRLSIPSMGPPSPSPFGTRRLAISRDGSQVAYASQSGILVRRMNQSEPVVVATMGSNPFFAPDGEWLAFFGEGGLMRVRVAGGPATPVAVTSERSGGGTWRGDGTIVFATTDGLYQVSQEGGPVKLLAAPDASHQERSFMWPQFTPDGRFVLFTILKEGSIDAAQIATLELQTGRRRHVLNGGTAAQYTSNGQLVFASGERLNAVTVDLVTSQLQGDPVAIPEIVLSTALDNGAAEFALSETGTLIFSGTSSLAPLRIAAWVDRTGREELLPLEPRTYSYPRVSPDGTLVAFDLRNRGNRDIWIWNVKRKANVLTRLTDAADEDMLPLWSIDGKRVFYSSNRASGIDVYSQAADGATPPRMEFAAPGAQYASGFTPDGTTLLVGHDGGDLAFFETRHPERLQTLLHSRFQQGAAVASPDGKWIAYESSESGQYDIYVRPFPNVDSGKEQVSVDGGRFPLWGPPGSGELFYVDLDGMMMSVPIQLEPTLSVGRPTRLFAAEKPPAGNSGRRYDFSPVHNRFLLLRPVATPAAGVVDITVVLNWLDELRPLVSAGPR